jgi:signal peptidase I
MSETDVIRRASVAREIALWVGAVLGGFCLLVSVVAVAVGITPLVFRSGSMEPQIPTGALGVAVRTDAADLRSGDVVSVIWSSGSRVTHRLVSKEGLGNGVFALTTKGDANADVDLEVVPASSVDRLIWSVPGAGYVVEEVSKPVWVFAAGILAGALIVIAFRTPAARGVRRGGSGRRVAARRDPVDDLEPALAEPLAAPAPSTPSVPSPDAPRPIAHRARRRGPLVVSLSLVLVLGAMGAVAPPTGTLAAFRVDRTGEATFTTTMLGTPAVTTCARRGLTSNIDVAWNAPTSGLTPTGYRMEVTKRTVLGGTVSPVTTNASTRTAAFTVNLLDIGAYDIRIFATYATNWRSQTPGAATGNVITGAVFTCSIP